MVADKRLSFVSKLFSISILIWRFIQFSAHNTSCQCSVSGINRLLHSIITRLALKIEDNICSSCFWIVENYVNLFYRKKNHTKNAVFMLFYLFYDWYFVVFVLEGLFCSVTYAIEIKDVASVRLSMERMIWHNSAFRVICCQWAKLSVSSNSRSSFLF